MDPNLFHLDWERTTEVLATIVILSMIIERSLAIVFEHRAFINRAHKKGVKEPLAFAVALLVCIQWDFDAVSMIVLTAKTTVLGKIITAGVIAGGSKGSIKLFRDYMGFKSTAYQDKKDEEKAEKKQKKKEGKGK